MKLTDAHRIKLHGYRCVYCGEAADSMDHFPPVSYGLHGFLLPACRECNCIAGTKYPLNFEGRMHHVKKRLRQKYKRHLLTPEWTKDEISELGYNLQEGTDLWQKQKQIAKERIAWNALAYLSSIDHNNDFAVTFVEGDFLEKVKKQYLNKPKN